MSDGTWTYTWEHGRQLASMSNGTSTWSYSYNADGLRTKGTDGTTTYEYTYNGDRLTELTIEKNGTVNRMYIVYDADGPFAINANGTTYYYVKNIQGDIIAIVNKAGKAVVEYTYDAWGNLLSIDGEYKNGLGIRNPLRYRGYVYDSESRLYYCQSRYYDPALSRFLNADAFVSTGQGLLGNNMFAYCGNNPVNMSDPNGQDPVTAGMIGGAVAGAVLSLMFYLNSAGENANFGEALLYTTLGAIGGALGGAAGMTTGDFQLACIIGAGVVIGLASNLSGGSFWIGSIWGSLSAYGGTFFDLSMFSGIELGTASYLSSTVIGFIAELFSQGSHEMIPEAIFDNVASYFLPGGSSSPIKTSPTSRNVACIGLS